MGGKIACLINSMKYVHTLRLIFMQSGCSIQHGYGDRIGYVNNIQVLAV